MVSNLGVCVGCIYSTWTTFSCFFRCLVISEVLIFAWAIKLLATHVELLEAWFYILRGLLSLADTRWDPPGVSVDSSRCVPSSSNMAVWHFKLVFITRSCISAQFCAVQILFFARFLGVYPLCMSTSGVKDSERFYRFGAAPFLWFSPTIFISFESPKFCPRAPYIILQVFFLCRYSCSCYKTREVIPSGKPSRPHKELILLLQVSSPLSAWFYHTLVPPVVFLVVFQSSLYMQDD